VRHCEEEPQGSVAADHPDQYPTQNRGVYLTQQELQDELADVYDFALERAALEVCGGSYSAEALATRVPREQVLERALALIVDDAVALH
jgi:hypothetical protein